MDAMPEAKRRNFLVASVSVIAYTLSDGKLENVFFVSINRPSAAIVIFLIIYFFIFWRWHLIAKSNQRKYLQAYVGRIFSRKNTRDILAAWIRRKLEGESDANLIAESRSGSLIERRDLSQSTDLESLGVINFEPHFENGTLIVQFGLRDPVELSIASENERKVQEVFLNIPETESTKNEKEVMARELRRAKTDAGIFDNPWFDWHLPYHLGAFAFGTIVGSLFDDKLSTWLLDKFM